MLEDDDVKEELSGSTAVTILIKDGTLYCVSDSLYIIISRSYLVLCSFNIFFSSLLLLIGSLLYYRLLNSLLLQHKSLSSFSCEPQKHGVILTTGLT